MDHPVYIYQFVIVKPLKKELQTAIKSKCKLKNIELMKNHRFLIWEN